MTKNLKKSLDSIDPLSTEIYRAINRCAKNKNWFVIDAQARNYHLEFKHGIQGLRTTRDFDLAIQVKNFEEFEALKLTLLEQEELSPDTVPHRIRYKSEIPIDIIPF